MARVLMLAVAPTVVVALLAEEQQNCLDAVHDGAQRLVATIGKEWQKCAFAKTKGRSKEGKKSPKCGASKGGAPKSRFPKGGASKGGAPKSRSPKSEAATNGSNSTVEACVAADGRDKIAKATIELGEQFSENCEGNALPDFAVAESAAAIESAAIETGRAIFDDVFGPSIDAGLLPDREGSHCQHAVVKSIGDCQKKKLKAFNVCLRDALGQGVDNAPALRDSCLGTGSIDQAGIGGEDIANMCRKVIAKDIQRKCVKSDVILSAAVPGCTSIADDPAELVECLYRIVRCRVCGFLDTIDDLQKDCDLFDDGINNRSCDTKNLVDPDDVYFLAIDDLGGRNNGNPESVEAQEYIIDQLEPIAAGLNSLQDGRDAYRQEFPSGTNILGVIEGNEKPREYVIIGAHYDHLKWCRRVKPTDSVCNGATDNAVGVAAVLGIGRAISALPTPPRRSVVLALWDAEEDGLVGSKHFTDNPLVPLEDTITYLNFDILGANLLPSLRDISFAIGAETGGTELQSVLRRAFTDEGLAIQTLSMILGMSRSDHANFADARVPFVFFSDSTGGCYHTTGDEVEVVDFAKLEKQTRITLKLTRELADTSTPPSFITAPLVVFDDFVALNDVINLAASDLDLFSQSDQADLVATQALLNALVADGPESFNMFTVLLTLGPRIISLVDTFTRVECDGFLLPST